MELGQVNVCIPKNESGSIPHIMYKNITQNRLNN